jgi:7-carboxy-7-deazaguanine synthase
MMHPSQKPQIKNLKSPMTDPLPLMEDFYTIQGEGFYQGHAAYFVRLGGCDVGCVWCDVKESWDVNAHPAVSVDQIAQRIIDSGSPMAVITGGEPAMHDLAPLTKALKTKGIKTNIETSGAYPLTGIWDWICLSPKKFMAPHPSVPPLANELKVIIYNKSDFEWAEKYESLVSKACELFLQPEWSREKEVLPEMIQYIKDHPRWKISLQIHKYMNIP